jgi:hypothetical protein
MMLFTPLLYIFYCMFFFCKETIIFFQEDVLYGFVGFLYSNINVYNISYNVLYFVSLCQIKVRQLTTQISQINNLISTNERDHISLEYYKDGILCHYVEVEDYVQIEDINNHIRREIYDYIVVSLYKLNKMYIHKCICSNTTNDLSLEESELRFISLSVNYNGEEYKLDLINNKTNYYVVNNVINKLFVKYYLENIYKIKGLSNEIKYDIHLIDNEVNIKNLTEEHSIVIYKDNYTII